MKGFFNMKRRLKVFCIAVLAATLALSSGCGVVSINTPYEETAPAETQPPETVLPPELDVYKGDYDNDIDRFIKRIADVDYDGATVKIVSAKNSLVMPDDKMGKVLSSDLEERNLAVEEHMNISIHSEQRDAGTMLAEIRACMLSGDYYADVIMLPQSSIGAYVTAGALLNMRSLPGFESDVGFFHSSAVGAGSGGDAVYAVAGPASLNADGLCGVYFNKDIVEECGFGDLYALADSGKWTIDKYIELTSAVTAAEKGYSAYTSQNASTYITDLFYFASGRSFTISEVGSYPVLNMGGEAVSTSVERIRSATSAGFAGSAVEGIETFKGGKTLFLIDTLDAMKTLASSEVNWGILPLPKADEKQEGYKSLAYYENAMFFGASPTITNYELCADLIACLNIMSYGYTPEAYVTNAAYYYLRDNQSVRMLASIVENPVYDFAYSFASENANIPSATFMALRKAVSGVSSLESYVSGSSYGFNQAMYYMFDVEE